MPRTRHITLSDRPADASSRRAALIVVALSACAFVVLMPVADRVLGPAPWFIPLFQSALIIIDLMTAALLLGQLRLGQQRCILVLGVGYVFAAVMATIHLLTFPGVFSPGGLLGAGPQSTAYLHVFWHLGLPLAVVAYSLIADRQQRLAGPLRQAVSAALAVVMLLAIALTALAILGSDLLPPMLKGDRYSSAFNIGRHGQWVTIAVAALVLWKSRRRSVLDLWLLVMLCNSFFEIALVSVFNSGRYDVGFYAGRVFAVLASCVVLGMLLVEHGKMYRELAEAQETARSEAALRETREVLQLAMHGGRMAAWSRDHDTGRTWWSPEVEDLTGWPVAAFGSSDEFFLKRVHADERDSVRRTLQTPHRAEFAVEFRLRHADGEWHWLVARGRSFLGEGARTTRLFGVLIDITERKRSEQAVTNTLESITDGFFSVDCDWRFSYVNSEAEVLLQRSRADLLGRHLWTEFPESVAVFRREYERAMAQQQTVHFEAYFEPLEIWVEVRAFPSSCGLSVYFHDVTARKNAEQRLRQSEERYRLLADMIPQHIWTTDANGYHTYFSRRWYEYTGASLEQTRGDGWLAMLHPDDRQPTLAAWHRALQTGEAYAVEYRFRGADGAYTWFLGQAAPLRDSAGSIVEWFGTLTDISERKRLEEDRETLLANEREAREEAERRREELERVTESRARLMRGFSHDLRNPLAAADGSAMLLADGRAFGALSDKQLEHVRRIRRGIRTSLKLIDDLLELAQAEAGQIELECVEVDIREVAHEIAEDFHAQAAAAGLAIEVRVPGGCRAQADPARLRQILGNLLSNAVKYAPNGRVTLHASLSTAASPGQGPRVAISVSDTGAGIPLNKRELVFEEYTRLDPGSQQGAGIGLAISRRIARLMGGDLTLESEVGQGSTFTLWLPASLPVEDSQPSKGATSMARN